MKKILILCILGNISIIQADTNTATVSQPTLDKKVGLILENSEKLSTDGSQIVTPEVIIKLPEVEMDANESINNIDDVDVEK